MLPVALPSSTSEADEVASKESWDSRDCLIARRFCFSASSRTSRSCARASASFRSIAAVSATTASLAWPSHSFRSSPGSSPYMASSSFELFSDSSRLLAVSRKKASSWHTSFCRAAAPGPPPSATHSSSSLTDVLIARPTSVMLASRALESTASAARRPITSPARGKPDPSILATAMSRVPLPLCDFIWANLTTDLIRMALASRDECEFMKFET
mmetsp:Transcript_57465/g.158200  ORF Transcript_57465/g.158200 Transcript_57465/m.158200 type:complete len:214 (-) Transcript_57465:343-984(-)